MRIWVDADACPVKDEVERLAARRGVAVAHVCGLAKMEREKPGVEVVYVEGGPDAADDWILANCRAGDIVITYDVPLAAGAVRLGAAVIEFRGRELDESNIGLRSQSRDLAMALREQNGEGRGPRPFTREDRRAFTAALGRVMDRLAPKSPNAANLAIAPDGPL